MEKEPVELTPDRIEKPLDSITTECIHHWQVIEADSNSDLISLGCLNCWSGASVSKENLSKYIKET